MSTEILFRSNLTPALRASDECPADLVQNWLGEVAEPLDAEIYRYDEDEEVSWQVMLHPAEEPLTVTLTRDSLEGYASTGNAGPGYHQYIVRALDDAESRWGLHWHIDDDTDFYLMRDREALEKIMVEWMVDRNHRVLTAMEDGWRGVLLGMPDHVRPVKSDFDILTPMGPRHSAWLEYFSNEKLQAYRFANEFPWWDEGLDATFWSNYGLTLCYLDVIWEENKCEEATLAARQAYDAFERALELDENADLPWPEFIWLANQLGRGDQAERIRAAASYDTQRPFYGGYRLGLLRQPLDDGWEIDLPGSWWPAYEDEEPNLRFVHGEQRLFFTAYNHVNNSPVEIEGGLRDAIRPEQDWVNGDVHGSLRIDTTQRGCMVQAIVATPDSVALANFWSERASDKNDMMQAVRSIARTPFAEDSSEYEAAENE